MSRRIHRTKAAETLKKSDPQSGFKFPDPSSSGADSDPRRKRRVTFDDADHRSPLNESIEVQAGPSVDAKTSEFAFFKKLKSDFGLCSNSNSVEQIPKTFDSRVKPKGTDREAKDNCKNYSFSTPIHNTRRGVNLSRKDIEKDPGKSSSGFSRNKDTVRISNNLRPEGISDEKGDLFSVKKKRLHQWVRNTWFTETPEPTSNSGRDLVSLLLTRLFPGTDDTPPSRFSKERTDRFKRRTFLDSPGSKFLKRSHENYSEVDHRLQMERDKSISWREWPENTIVPSLEFATDHFHSSFITGDPEQISFSISDPEGSVYRPQFLKQRASLSFPVEKTLDCFPVARLHYRNYKPLSLGYHREESGYISEDVFHDDRDSIREPSSALLLEWNTETSSTRKTDDLPLSYDTKLITYPDASFSYLTDNPWSSDYSSSNNLVTRELYPLPLLSHYTSDSFLLPTTNQSSHFEHELERPTIDDDNVVAANQKLQTLCHTNSSDCLTRDYTYYHNLLSSPEDHCPFKVPGCEIVPFPFSSIDSSNLLEASSPTRSKSFKSRDWIPFQFQSPQDWID